MLEDVERIEVIRGPGATLWGANAVAELQETFALSDAENLERAAHKLKSAAAVFDARGVVETAQRLEILGRQNNVSAAGEILSYLDGQIAELTRALQESLAVERKQSTS